MIDFFGSWSVPHALTNTPKPNIYSPDAERDLFSIVNREAAAANVSDTQRVATAAIRQTYDGRLDVTGSPLQYSLVGVVSSGDFAVDHQRWLLLIIVAVVTSICMLCAALQYDVVSALLLLVFVLAGFAPFVADVQVGNVNSIQLLGLAIFVVLYARGFQLGAGGALGITTALKPTTAVVVVVLVIAAVVDRRYRSLIRVLVGWSGAIAIGIAASTAYLGDLSVWRDFAASLPHTLSTEYPVANGNFSVTATLFGRSSAGALITVIFLAVFSLVMARSRSPHTQRDWPAGVACVIAGVGCASTVLGSPLAWLHYYVLMLPLLAYVLGPSLQSRSAQEPWIQAAVRAIPLVLFSTLVNPLTNGDAVRVALVTNVGAFAAFALAMRRLFKERHVDLAAVPAERRTVAKGRRR